ncbi:transcriptional regulatory protein AlgP-like [Anopheles moucheti]|uniref:transcriptional regulatory protein AlgP-like n=1 Tax=Anopheles moucheti TaxID=186751 RepID=UPI0022EFDD84|nr:transcriptional regulatory protein AlgP-like [Anopheles moucheti]
MGLGRKAKEPKKKSPSAVLGKFRTLVEGAGKDEKVVEAKPKLLRKVLALLEDLLREKQAQHALPEPANSGEKEMVQSSGTNKGAPKQVPLDEGFVVQTKKGRVPKPSKGSGVPTPKGNGQSRAKPAAQAKVKVDAVKPRKALEKPKPAPPPKAKKAKRKPRSRPEAILVASEEAGSYADILKGFRTNEGLKEVGQQVAKIRRAQNGHMLIELKRGESAHAVAPALAEALKDKAKIRPLAPTKIVELRDLDEIATVEEIVDALKEQTKISIDDTS